MQTEIANFLLSAPGTIDPAKSGLYQITAHVAADDSSLQQALLKTYYDWAAAPTDSLSDRLSQITVPGAGVPSVPVDEAVVKRFLKSTRVLALTGSNGLLSERALKVLEGTPASGDPSISGASAQAKEGLLTRLSEENWRTIIDNVMDEDTFFFPDFIVAATPEAAKESYASFLKKQIDITYPTHAFARSVEAATETPFPQLKSKLAGFLDSNPTFDLRTTPVVEELAESTALDFTGITDRDAFISEAAIAQRLLNVTPNHDLVAALAADGTHSALQISRQPQDDFIASYSGVAGSIDDAVDAYESATGRVLFNFTLVTEQYTDLSGIKHRVLDGRFYDPENTYAEWRTLFGSLDGCNCSECQSVYSPAAYLTDLLEFLKNSMRQTYDILLQRRPDLKDIELVCKNVNTPVPHIDIVNELLEDLVSTVAKNGGYKMYARQTVADAAAQRAIPEYVNIYPTTSSADGMQVKEWNSTTNLYDNAYVRSPYPTLKNAVGTSSLPYNFYKRQIDTHLNLSGVKSYEILQRFSGADAIEGWENGLVAASYLGLSEDELNIITATYPGTSNPYLFYGLKPDVAAGANKLKGVQDPAVEGTTYPATGQLFLMVGNPPTLQNPRSGWVEQLAFRVDIFLQQAGIDFRELQTILDCYFINPWTIPVSNGTRKMAIRSNTGIQADDTTCDLKKLQILGMDADAMYKIHRFIRLRRALGWTYYDLDQAMISVNHIAPQNLLTAPGIDIELDTQTLTALVELDRVAKMLQLPVSAVIPLWKDIDDLLIYTDYSKSEPELIKSNYKQLFRNPLIGNIKDAGYPFPEAASALDLQHFNANPGEFQNYLSGIFNIATADFKLLIEQVLPAGLTTSGTNKLGDISKIYREVLLLKALGLTMSEWLQCRTWMLNDHCFNAGTGIDSTYDLVPNAFAFPYNAICFISFVHTLKEAGISMNDAGYLLLDAFPDNDAETAQSDLLVKRLTSLRNQLQKKTAAAYATESDKDGSALKGLLESIMDADAADYLIKIAQNDPLISADSAMVRNEFITELLAMPFSTSEITAILTYPPQPAESDTDSVKAAKLAAIELAKATARQIIYDVLKATIEEQTRRPFVISFLAKELKTDEAVITTLLEDCIKVDASTPAVDVFLDPVFIDSVDIIDRWSNNAQPFKALIRLQKAVWLISKFKLELEDVSNLWGAYPAISGIFSLSELPVAAAPGKAIIPDKNQNAVIPFCRLLAFLRWMKVCTFLGKKTAALYNAIRNVATTAPDRKRKTLKGIAEAFSMSVEDLEVLLGDSDYDLVNDPAGALVVDFPEHTALVHIYNVAKLYLRIIDCLEMQHLLPAPMSTLAAIADAIAVPDSQKKANEIIQVVKAQYDDPQWLAAIRPVSDQLRAERRDAMVAYLLLNPPNTYINQWRNSNDIFETLMVDVDMMTCMSTTRVLLAINTIQLWVDRILLGLEKYPSGHTTKTLELSKPQARQWQMWRKLYRVWEANRKIFIYPENWIEPDLRDGKSPFFIELEKFLKQNELTDTNVEDAYNTYLERLEEVANLDVVAMYREANEEVQTSYSAFNYTDDVTKRDTIHVFGRTQAQPHIYYYRKRVADEWTPWEKMDVQIDGDHFVPVMWRGKLRFYWLVFMKDQLQDSASKMTSQDKYVLAPATRWKIQLAWTEYKNGKWTAKQMSKDALYSTTVTEENPVSRDHLGYAAMKWGNRKRWWFEGFLERQKKQSFRFYAKIDEAHGLRLVLTEQVYSPDVSWFYYAFVYANNPTYPLTDQNFSNDLAKIINTELNKSWQVGWITDLGFFNIQFQGATVSPLGNPDTNTLGEEKNLYNDKINYSGFPGIHNYDLDNTQYHYNLPANQGYRHLPDDAANNLKLLGYAPDVSTAKPTGKYIVFPRVTPLNYTQAAPLRMPYFFYKDYDNSFFVENVTRPLSLIVGTVDNGSPEVDVALGGSGTPPVSFDSGNTFDFFGLNASQYRFHNFKHNQIEKFREKLFKEGLDGLLDYTFISTTLTDSIGFKANYQPTANVAKGTDEALYPTSKVSFDFDNATSLYNWELFFHIPMLIANKLMLDQKFEEARKWFHYVFNPTIGGTKSVANFWNFPVFNKNATNVPTPLDLMKDPNLSSAVARWANDPFKPHLVARTRVSAYMKNVVMKYLDNLIGWGDMLFRTDTRENINEATLLYVLSAQLTGRRPTLISPRATPVAKTYISLASTSTGLNAFSNGLVNAENFSLSTGATRVRIPAGSGTGLSTVASGSMYYFGIPSNDKLLSYWDTIADRLFKIRNCRNIDGVERELALFDPPIDPALLVKAAAAGISLSEALSDINSPLPVYRFAPMSQKATELTQEVKGLGSQLLSALEKKDAEHLSLLRSGQELTMLNLVTEVKEQQVEESVSQINGLQQQQLITTQRRDYYKRLVDNGLNAQEQLQLDSIQNTIPLALAQGSLQTLSGIFYAIPDIMIGPFSSGVGTGGHSLGALTGAAASAAGTVSTIQSIIGQMASIKGGYNRRKEDWDQQLKTAETELKQLDQQILGAQIRKAMAELELRNHQTQLKNAQEMDTAMHEKYTNEELYDWMAGEISYTYFQAYKLALDVAKRAERCYRYELGMESSDFIQPAYWDSLKKGLLSGEQLMYDIKRMEASFLDKNKRQLELTRHISMAQLCPDELIRLKTEKKCDISIPEWVFDLDYPGQHLRRIKSVTVSIPCVAGPYTTVSCKLSLVSSKYRKAAIMVNNYNHDDNYKQMYGSIQSIATSSAQNDSGMFEFSFRDERYLPFEGAGAVSKWRIELPAAYAQFDYDTISDLILHINYTALDEGSLKEEATTNVTNVLKSAAEDNGFMRLFDVNREFASESYAYNAAYTADSSSSLTLKLSHDHFPFYTSENAIEILGFRLGIVPKAELNGCKIELSYKSNGTAYSVELNAENLMTGKLHTPLKIDRNVKILKVRLKNASGFKNITGSLEELQLVAICRLADLDTDAENDQDWSTATDATNNAQEPLGTPVLVGIPADGSVTLTWNAVENASQYIVQQSFKSTFPTYATKVVYKGSALTVTITGLPNNKPVYFRIKALSDLDYLPSAYSTVQVTPAVDVLPASIKGKMVAWWKADAVDNNVVSGKLNIWKDQSGKGQDVQAVSTAARPEIINDWKNGKPALKFDGAQALKNTMLTLPANTEDITVFIVGEKTSTAQTQYVFELSPAVDNHTGIVFFNNYLDLDSAYLKAGGVFSSSGMAKELFNQEPVLYELGYIMSNDTAPEPYIKVQGVQQSNVDFYPNNHVGNHFNSDAFFIGARNGAEGFAHFNMAEMIIISAKVTAEERTTINNYLSQKYSLEISPVSGMAAWWKSSEGIAVSNNRLTNWSDLSGNGNHLASVGNASPYNNLASLKGIPAATFLGNEWMTTAAFSDSESFTVTMLVRMITANPAALLGRNSGIAEDAGWALWVRNDAYAPFSVTPGGTFVPAYQSLEFERIVGAWEVVTLRRDATNGLFTAWKNGVKMFETACGNSFKLTNMPITVASSGSGGNGAFDLLETIIYQNAIDDAGIKHNHQYLNQKYDLQIAPVEGAAAWWKADDGITIASNRVALWKDQSGNNNDLAPSVSEYGPVVTAPAMNGIHPLSFGTSTALYTGAFQDTDSYTATVLVRLNTTATTGILGRSSTQAVDSGWTLWTLYDQYAAFTTAITGGVPIAGYNLYAPSVGKWDIITVRRDAYHGHFSLWKNGQEVSVGSCSSPFVTSGQPISIGSLGVNQDYGNFDMLEALIYQEALSDNEIAANHQYLQAKYNLPVIPEDHIQGWWRSDHGVDINTNGEVIRWKDQSGNGRTAVPIANIPLPQYSSHIVTTTTANPGMLKLEAPLNLGKVYTLSIVAHPTVTFKELLGSMGLYGSNISYGLYSVAGNLFNHSLPPGYFIIQPSQNWPPLDEVWYRLERDNDTLSLYYNDMLVGIGTTAVNNDFIIDNLYGESNLYSFVGGIKDIILYDKLLNDDEKTQLKAYINNKYGL